VPRRAFSACREYNHSVIVQSGLIKRREIVQPLCNFGLGELPACDRRSQKSIEHSPKGLVRSVKQPGHRFYIAQSLFGEQPVQLPAKAWLRVASGECRKHLSIDFGKVAVHVVQLMVDLRGDHTPSGTQHAHDLRDCPFYLGHEHQDAVSTYAVEGCVRELELANVPDQKFYPKARTGHSAL